MWRDSLFHVLLFSGPATKPLIYRGFSTGAGAGNRTLVMIQAPDYDTKHW